MNIQPLEETGGSNTVGPGNVIGFNELDGVMVMGSNNVVQGNYIGTDAAGNDLGNGGNGVNLYSLLETEGSNTVGPGNVIGFNDSDGVVIWGSDNDLSNTREHNILRVAEFFPVQVRGDVRTCIFCAKAVCGREVKTPDSQKNDAKESLWRICAGNL